MIALLSGTVLSKHANRLVLLTSGGVGYDVFMTPLRLTTYMVGKEATVHTYLKVSDSDLQIYGFGTLEERDFFTLLLTVSGVGPKTASNVLSLGSIPEIQSAIGRGDVKYLTAVSGLGKKIAERLVVELKSKLGHVTSNNEKTGDSTMIGEVIDALESMGYSREEAKDILMQIDSKDKTTEQLLRLALQQKQR
mgnify:FL=1